MENGTFKSVTFGGFDKQDVIRYIEKSAQEAAELQQKLQGENDALRKEIEALREKVHELESRLESETAFREKAQADLEEERSARKELEGSREEAQRLAVELERLRPEAEAYAQFRDRLGDIECDAHKRAAELEASTTAKLRRAVELFRGQYKELMSSFDATSAHVTAELRKVEVNLAQLPRAMDPAGKELEELTSVLEQAGKKGERKERA